MSPCTQSTNDPLGKHEGQSGPDIVSGPTKLPWDEPEPPPRSTAAFEPLSKSSPNNLPHFFSTSLDPVRKQPYSISRASVTPLEVHLSDKDLARIQDGNTNLGMQVPASKLPSKVDISGTARSSADFVSFSGDSSGTLTSVYDEQDYRRQTAQQRQSGHTTDPGNSILESKTEHLMMGYIQLGGTFSVDTSLLSTSAFDEARRKGIVGDQGGGGLVRDDPNQRGSGIFGALHWGKLASPLEGLLGGSHLSSINDSKAYEGSVPIISTPQSILFVNLHLHPGESKAFEYSYHLPEGIPPTHEGKAIKINYQLTIGTQSFLAKDKKHHVQHIDIPFRVLPGITGMS